MNKSQLSTILLLCFCTIALHSHAQEFDTFFVDKTLRVDYIFSGDTDSQTIAVDEMSVLPRWYGKRTRLAEVPVEGNGQIVVRHHDTQQVIYRNSFSTLFQEWLSYDEAKTTKKAFENVFLIPMPKATVDITVDLRNNRREVMASFRHTIDPADILIREKGTHAITPFETIQQAEDTTQCIHIAFVAEGYTEKEMGLFISDAQAATDAIFAHEPFKSHRNRFNIIAVKAPSQDSGTSHPAQHIWKKTALDSNFNTFYSDRYLTTLHLKKLHDWLAGTPYEHIIVLVNTTHYGGGGILNSYNLAMAHHPQFKPVVVHEFGHSFAGLADEYAYESEDIPMYPHDIEPWEPNITTLTHFEDKWKEMVGTASGIGLYEGAGYSMKGVYRPADDCRMRTNGNPEFCKVCQKAITRLIDFYTQP